MEQGCIWKLPIIHHAASCMTATDAHAKLSKQFIKLSEQCHKQINADAVGW